MLLRSSSTPILDSWRPHSKDSSSPEPEFQILQRTKSNISFHSQSSIDDPLKKVIISTQEPNFQKSMKGTPVKPPPQINKQQCKNDITNNEEKEAKPSSRIQRLFSSSGLGERVANDDSTDGGNCGLQTLVVGGGGMGSGGGGGICGGGSGGNGGRRSDGGDGNGGSEFYGNHNTDAYYQKMISADPGNALLLGNYAKFLKEVRGDFSKAEEFCGRAILANPNDGNILSIYGDLVWQKERDAQRAESYFDQAIKTDPKDCYVLASYAKFLWDTEEEEENENENEDAPSFFHGPPQPPPLAAAY